MVFNTLTEAPHNLKEGIDWLIAVKGTDAGNHLAALGQAVHTLLADKPVGYTDVPALEKVKRISKEFLQQPELMDYMPVDTVLAKFNKPIDKNPQFFQKLFRGVDKCNYTNIVKEKSLSASTIAQKLGKAVDGFEKFLRKITNTEQYKSAYSSEATWEKSCSEKPEDCAAVFVGIAPMLWAGLNTLDFATQRGKFSWIGVGNKGNVSAKLLSALGFSNSECLSNTTAANVASAVAIVKSNELQTVYDLSGFWAFYDCTKLSSIDAEPSVDGEGEQSVIPEAEPSVEGEGEQSLIPEDETSFEGEPSLFPEDEKSFEGEGEQSLIPEAEPTVDGEGEQSLIPEAEPSVEGEGEQSVIPEVEPSVEPAGEEPVIPEAEPSVEPVKPEVDEVEKPVKVAKAAKVARSVKAAKKAAKKVSKKARQRKEKRKQKKQQEEQAQQESAEQ